MVFNVGGPPAYRAGKQLAAMPAFHDAYQPIAFEAVVPMRHRGTFYVRRQSPRIGIRRDSHGLIVPGFLLKTRGPTRLDHHRVLVAQLEAGERSFVDLPKDLPPDPTITSRNAVAVKSSVAAAVVATWDKRRPHRLVLKNTTRHPVQVAEILIDTTP
jgi:hypothetical protein